tara:strand:+ start:10859 stop:11242 length:384 start_codon:yes stop_codon:yes gene_type:complete
MKVILAPVSIGELIDKITILQIKEKHMDGNKLLNIQKELKYLNQVVKDNKIKIKDKYIDNLREINLNLWNIEDQIREFESKKSFGNQFVKLARSVYLINDKRAAAKKELNIQYGSDLVEEKIYTSLE